MPRRVKSSLTEVFLLLVNPLLAQLLAKPCRQRLPWHHIVAACDRAVACTGTLLGAIQQAELSVLRFGPEPSVQMQRSGMV